MRSVAALFAVIVLCILSFACTKEASKNESVLYGTWVKGSNPGDTIWFIKKSSKHIVRYASSFNPNMPMYSENEYKYNDGKLSIKRFPQQTDEYFPVTSFTWVQSGREFSIVNSELFPFLSSIYTLKYKKI